MTEQKTKEEKPKKLSTQKQVEILRDEFHTFEVETNKVLDFLLAKLDSPAPKTAEAEKEAAPKPPITDETLGKQAVDLKSSTALEPNQVESPVPPRFREIVDEVLGSEFGLKCYTFRDNTDFQIDIQVPEKYTSMPKQERGPDFVDVRSKIINRALGETGVRDWAKKIRANLTKYFSSQGLASPFQN